MNQQDTGKIDIKRWLEQNKNKTHQKVVDLDKIDLEYADFWATLINEIIKKG